MNILKKSRTKSIKIQSYPSGWKIKNNTFNKFLIGVLLLLMLDGLIITPFALYNFPQLKEANPLHSFFIERIGMIYFYIAIPIIVVLIFLFFKFLERLVNNKLDIKYHKLVWIFAFIIPYLIMFYAIINNLNILWRLMK